MTKRERSPHRNGASSRVAAAAVLFVLGVLALAALANAMVKPLGRDEHMYCTAGVLLAQGKLIYRDFCYVAQLPCHPLFLSLLYRALATTHYLLVGRLLSVVCDVGTMLAIVWIFRRAFGPDRRAGLLLGLAGVLLYAFNPVVDYANGYAWNNDAVVFCIVLAFGLYASIDPQHPSRYRLAAALGVVLSVATWMRMTSAAYLATFLVMLLVLPATDVRQRIRTGLAYLGAVAVVSLWPMSVIMRAPQAFAIDAFQIHMINSKWLAELDMVLLKSRFVADTLKQPSYIFLFLIAVFLAGALTIHRPHWWDTGGRQTLLAVTLVTLAFLIALVLPTILPQYLAPPVPLMVIAFAYPLARLRRGSEGKGRNYPFAIAAVLMGLGAFVAVSSSPEIVGRIGALVAPKLWTPMRVHRISCDIVDKAKEPKLVLTTAPLYALEGGGQIYPEFAAGPFPYRIGTLLSDEQRRLTHTAGPEGLQRLMAESPPQAVLVGVESGRLTFLEEPFQAMVGENWPRTTYRNGLVAYHRP